MSDAPQEPSRKLWRWYVREVRRLTEELTKTTDLFERYLKQEASAEHTEEGVLISGEIEPENPKEKGPGLKMPGEPQTADGEETVSDS